MLIYLIFLLKIGPSARLAAKEMLKSLELRGKRQAEIVAELSVMWLDPVQRLEQVFYFPSFIIIIDCF